MKRALAILVMVFAANAIADTWTDPDTGYTWTYRIVGDAAEIYGSEIYNPSTYSHTYTPCISPSPIGSVIVPYILGGKLVTSIGSYAFRYCSGLTSVIIPESVTNIGNYAFYHCSGLTSTIMPDSITSIGDFAFGDCSGLTSVTIPDGMTSIGRHAFTDCSGLTSIMIPGRVTSIGEGVFSGCSGLTGVTICNGVTSIGFTMFYGCSSLTSMAIPDSVTSIGNYAFAYCSGLKIITIPDSVTSIGDGAFHYCNAMERFIVGEGNLSYSSVNGLLLTKDAKTLIAGLNGDIVIPDIITRIGSYAFRGYSGLTSVIIPDSVTSIGANAFENCIGLTNVTIPESVTWIGSSAFRGCNELINVTIPENVTIIGRYMFYNCSGLTSVVIPDGVTSIEDYAFYGCCNLPSVTIPNGVTRIGYNAFYNCSGLTSITIPESVANIDYGAFAGCARLTAIYTPSLEAWCAISFYGKENTNPLSVAHGLYVNGTLLQHLTIPDGVTKIGWNQFEGCDSLLSVAVPEGVTMIDRFAFRQCSNLGSVLIAGSVTNIEWDAFSSCSNLTSVTMKGNCPSLGRDAFNGIASDCKVYLPRGNETYDVVDGKWQEMTVEWYDIVNIGVENDKGEVVVVEGGYVVTAKEDATLTEDDFTFGAVAKEAYKVEIALDGKSATVTLNTPQVGVLPEHEDEAPKDEEDKSGLLVEVGEDKIAAKPETKEGQEVGALPVKTYPGLYYRAAWGDDLGSMTTGSKVQATGDSLYLGVIKQKGPKGFYRLTVSEQ